MISIIVCTYNREKYIYECLKRLITNKTYSDWELLVIDNNSTDNTLTEIKRFEQDFKPQNYRYVLEKQQGLSFARNRGIKEAKGEWIVFLDDDAFVGENYINQLNEYILEIPDMQAFGGKILPLFEDGKTPEWLCRWNSSWVSALDMGNKVKLFSGSAFPTGANMGFKRQLVDLYGLFNTQLGRTGKNLIGGEEKDFFNRLKKNNIKIYYLPQIPVNHCIPSSRTNFEYIQKLGYGVGKSEQYRTLNISRLAYLKQLFSEFLKWGATIVLATYYCFSGKTLCAKSLVLFRKQVTKGLIS